jgi:hypothetical protein
MFSPPGGILIDQGEAKQSTRQCEQKLFDINGAPHKRLVLGLPLCRYRRDSTNRDVGRK